MMAADVRLLIWSAMNTRSPRWTASVPTSRLLTSHMVQARRLTPASRSRFPPYREAQTLVLPRLSHVSRTSATSLSPRRRHAMLSVRAPAAGSRPVSASSAWSVSRDSANVTPGSDAHQRACQATAAVSKRSGSRASRPRQVNIPCSSDPRTTALGRDTRGRDATSGPWVGEVSRRPRRRIEAASCEAVTMSSPVHAAAGSSVSAGSSIRRGSSVSRAMTRRWICEVPS
jgi:hypothetical protein